MPLPINLGAHYRGEGDPYHVCISGADQAFRTLPQLGQDIVQCALAVHLMHEAIEGEASVNLGNAEVLGEQLALFAAAVLLDQKVWPPGSETCSELLQLPLGDLSVEPLMREETCQ